jgi:putative transposase
MPRQARIVVPRLPHHVYLRGNNRRRLFSSHADRVDFLGCLERAVTVTECLLHQLTLMDNHVHMIAVPPSRPALSALIARTCQRYAQQRNASRETSGKLFEERFHSNVIDDEAGLMTVTLYNDANGFRVGLADSPFDHVWSTGPLHAGGRSLIPARLWTPSAWYRGLAADPQDRAARYRQLMLAYVARGRGDARPYGMPHEVAERADRRRFERPDGTSVRDVPTQWPQKAKSS